VNNSNVETITYLIYKDLPYFPAHKTHFFPWKMWPKFDLRLMRRG